MNKSKHILTEDDLQTIAQALQYAIKCADNLHIMKPHYERCLRIVDNCIKDTQCCNITVTV